MKIIGKITYKQIHEMQPGLADHEAINMAKWHNLALDVMEIFNPPTETDEKVSPDDPKWHDIYYNKK
jgi:uridylate kinase